MMTQNIKNGLQEYITNSYLEKEIDNKYEEIKVSLSELDAEFKLTAENATRKTLVVNNDSLKYLEKYGFEIISLDDSTNPISEKVIDDVVAKIKANEVKHLFVLENTNLSEVFQKVVTETGVETFTYRRLDSITDEERNEKENYFTIMNNNIELLRDELY